MKNNKDKLVFPQWLKQYAPLVIIVVCIIAITTLVIITSLGGEEQSQLPSPDTGKTDDTVKTPDPLEDYLKPSDDQLTVLPKKTWFLPVSNYTIGMDYSSTEFTYSETLKEWLIHKAIDFIVSDGSEVYSVADGTVESVRTSVMEGTTVTIVHDDGIRSIYSSLAAEPPVKANQRVKGGELIGYASDSGYNEFLQGAHLHFEMTKDKATVNPRDYLTEI